MTIALKLARDEFVTEALRMVEKVMGENRPPACVLEIIAGLKAMRPDAPPRVISSHRIDYLSQVQGKAHGAWRATHSKDATGPENDAIASVHTPIGRLKAVTYRRKWVTGRIAWATEYYLDDSPITIREIRAAGLAQRPTTRNRQRRVK